VAAVMSAVTGEMVDVTGEEEMGGEEEIDWVQEMKQYCVWINQPRIKLN